jgi:ATP-dependent helicase/nuclease subunit A
LTISAADLAQNRDRIGHEAAAQDEYHRLLYVAMTRAEERLYVAGHFGKRLPSPLAWLNAVREGLADDLGEAPAFWDASDAVLRRVDEGRPPPQDAPAAASAAVRAAAPPV